MNILKRKPKQNIIKHCPRIKAGWPCRTMVGMPCPDCGRGVV